MSLEEQINKHAAKVSTTAYSMSVGEIVSMYKDGEIDLHPSFQRFFRWTPEQKSRFIESLLLGIPIPPVFVAELKNAHWDVIDGLQRISTILELMGELRMPGGEKRPQLELSRTRNLPDLHGMLWSNEADPSKELSEAAKIRIKRARLDVNILRYASDEVVKFEIFQRLNTGATIATDQEVRNCLLLMVNPEFFEWTLGLSRLDAFRACIPITEKALEEGYDLELVTRFIVFSTAELNILSAMDELGAFITDKMIEYAKDKSFDKKKIEDAFSSVFDFLNGTVSADAFRRYDTAKSKYSGGLLISLFEVVAMGLGHSLLAGGQLPQHVDFVTQHKTLWQSPPIAASVGSGVRASTRIPKTIAYGRQLFKV